MSQALERVKLDEAAGPPQVTLLPARTVDIPAPENYAETSKSPRLAKWFAPMVDHYFPAVSVHALREPLLLKNGAVVLSGYQVPEESLEGSFEDNGFLKTGSESYAIDERKSPSQIDEPVITIQKLGVFNYAIWLSEILTRAHAVTQVEELRDVPILLRLPPFMKARDIEVRYRTLEYIGVPRARLRPLEAESARCDLLYFPRVNTRYLNHRIPQNLDAMTNLIRDRIVGSEPVERAPIYIPRSDGIGRKITNEPELIRELEALGFRMVVGTALSFEEQVMAFAGATMVFGTHGAGLTNIGFAPCGTPVVELFPYGFAGRRMFRVLAYAKGHRYFSDEVPEALCGKGEKNDFEVDVRQCMSLVERALNATP